MIRRDFAAIAVARHKIDIIPRFSARAPLCFARASLYMRLVGPWRSLVSASVWGAEGREFESLRPDHSENACSFSGTGVSPF